jgi:hypothetical protein
MPRKSKIEQLGIGDKIVWYSVKGMNTPQIIARIALDCPGVTLTHDQIERHLHTQSALISEQKALARNNSIEFTLKSIKKELLNTIDEIRAYIEKYPDNPKAVASGLKLKLDALEKMTKMLGGYAPESQVNVQVNVATKSIEDQAKEFEAYFQGLEGSK